MSDHLLDTNVLIRCLRGLRPALQLLEHLAARGALNVSVLSRVEVLARMWPREQAATVDLLSALTALPVTTEVADTASRLISGQSRQGIALPVPDALIVATAQVHNLTLVTYDRRHLDRIDGLRLYSVTAGENQR